MVAKTCIENARISYALAVRRYQGEFLCLWHNTELAATDTNYRKRLDPRVLDYLAGLLENAD